MNYLWKFILVTLSLILLSVTVFAGESRIVGGTIVESNERVRHQVSIRLLAYDNVFGNGHICGGMLIAADTVLTAAHCMIGNNNEVRAASEFRIAAGTLELFGSPSTLFYTSVSEIRVHENYNPNTYLNDIAVMKLTQSIPTDNAAIYPVNLRTVPVQIGTTCQVTGWGQLSYLETSIPNELRTADITVYDLDICNSTTSYQGLLQPGMLCIGNMAGGVDSCSGDNGGPVICDGLLTGVVSFGLECALPNFPGIYTDVDFQKSWIFANQEIV